MPDRTPDSEDALRQIEWQMLRLQITRAYLIEQARLIARDLIARDGETHARLVLDEMEQRHMQDDLDIVKGFWMGAVFRGREFKWTGKWYIPPEEIRRGSRLGIRPLRIWTLR